VTPPGSVLERLPLPVSLTIKFKKKYTGFNFTPFGEFPRRVREGEQLALDGKFPLLAPLTGLVQLNKKESLFHLKMEGVFQIGRSIDDENRPYNIISSILINDRDHAYSLFLQKLREAGIPSLDFFSRPLYELFENALEHPEPYVILSNVDAAGAINWNSIFKKKSFTTDKLINFLGKLLPGAKIINYPPQWQIFRSKPSPSNYGSNLPEVIAHELLKSAHNIDFRKPLDKQGIVFLGPATIQALLDHLNDDIPFTSKIAAFRFQMFSLKYSRVKKNTTLLFQIPNGMALSDIFNIILEKTERLQIIQGDFFRNSHLNFDSEELQIFNIYQPDVYHIVKRQYQKNYAFDYPCSGCMACQNVCPVGASPVSIVEGRPDLFRVNDCLLCGLCEYVCESSIQIIEAICDIKQKMQQN